MEGGNEQDYDEFEMLLGEIPNATSANPPSDESGLAKNLAVKSPEGEKSSPSVSFTNFYHSSKAAKTSPNAASVSPIEAFPPIYGSLGFDRTTCLCPSNSSYDQKLQADGNLDGGSNNVKNDCQTNIVNVDQDRDCLQIEPNLPDEQSLASAFASISFKDGIPTDPAREIYVQYKSLPNSAFLLEEQYRNSLNKSHSSLEAVQMATPPSPNRVSCLNFLNPASELQRTRNLHGTGYPSVLTANGLAKITEEIRNQESADLLKLNVHEIKKQTSGSCFLNNFPTDLAEQRRDLPVFSGQMPIAPGGIPTFQVLPNGPVSGIEFPVSPFPQQFFLDAHSSPYIQSQHFSHPNAHMQQLNCSHLSWQLMEEERFRRMHQQQLYLQQIQNQGPGARPIQASGNAAIGSLTRTSGQPYFDFPIPSQIDTCNRDPYWDNNAFSRGFNQSDLAVVGGSLCRYYAQGFCGRGENCPFSHDQKQTISSGLTCQSAKDFQGIHVPDKEGKQVFPEKILTRSRGLDSLRAIKPCSLGNVDSPNHANSNRSVFSNGLGHPSISSTGSFILDGRSSLGSSPDKWELKLALRSQPQKYNSLDEVAGRIYFMAKDQHGCRFLQRKFVEGTSEDVEKIFVEIIGHIVELMTDPFGNYLIQKLLEVCSEDHMMQILRAITANAGELVSISCNMHGTRAVQKVIETLKSREQYSMVLSSLKPGILTLIKDLNGNHVVQRCLQCLTHEHNETDCVVMQIKSMWLQLNIFRRDSRVRCVGVDRKFRPVYILRQSSRKMDSLTDPISLENIDLTDEWVVEAKDDDAPLLDVDEIDDWMDVADAILGEGEGGAAAGFFLNPRFHYQEGFESSDQIRSGVTKVIERLVSNVLFAIEATREFLFDAATAHCVDIATHRNGCCVLQKCLYYSDGEQRRRLVSEIALNALVLSQDPYGNYVIQYIFDLGISWATTHVLDQLEGNYAYLSMQKYSSNVVEKCLKSAGEERRVRIIRELMQYSRLGEILQDPFGNYVVQSALASCKGALHAAFVEAIRPHVPSLRSSPYGKRVLSNNNLKK